jgi:hypothetical protein
MPRARDFPRSLPTSGLPWCCGLSQPGVSLTQSLISPGRRASRISSDSTMAQAEVAMGFTIGIEHPVGGVVRLKQQDLPVVGSAAVTQAAELTCAAVEACPLGRRGDRRSEGGTGGAGIHSPNLPSCGAAVDTLAVVGACPGSARAGGIGTRRRRPASLGSTAATAVARECFLLGAALGTFDPARATPAGADLNMESDADAGTC